ncbi:Gfo/Idh/MocA family protein [Candidatus Poriferisodalis sp.]|uniref:Gfo/Idh/MocA family protein n=1 Tax=Candidatus Poriferisodalis sp. TaxID=3101277 RepID=UPI003B0132F2
MSALAISDGGAATSRPLRFGVIGTGMMGREHIANLMALDGAEVSALCDNWAPSLDAAQQLLGTGSDVLRFADHQELLDSNACDAVVVATPNHLHTDIVLDIAATGLPQLVEKPLANTLADCRRIIDGVGRLATPPLVWMGLEYRYIAPVAELIRETHAGTVGRVRMVSIREHRFPFQPKVRDWNRFNRNTGGTLVEKCCHFFDLMRLIVRSDPVRVLASGGQDLNHLDESYSGEVPDILDNAFVIVDFASGTRALLDLCMFADATRHQEEISVVGDDGKLEALVPSSVLRVGLRGRDWIGNVEEREVTSTAPVEGHHHGSSFIELERFRDAVICGTPAESTLGDGLWSVAIGHAAHRSIDEGRPVMLDELLNAAATT